MNHTPSILSFFIVSVKLFITYSSVSSAYFLIDCCVREPYSYQFFLNSFIFYETYSMAMLKLIKKTIGNEKNALKQLPCVCVCVCVCHHVHIAGSISVALYWLEYVCSLFDYAGWWPKKPIPGDREKEYVPRIQAFRKRRLQRGKLEGLGISSPFDLLSHKYSWQRNGWKGERFVPLKPWLSAVGRGTQAEVYACMYIHVNNNISAIQCWHHMMPFEILNVGF